MAGGASKKTALCAFMAVVASSFSIHGLNAGGSPNTGVRAEAGTTITLEAPNNWTQSGSSFGPAWQQEMALFKATTGITVKSDVLPLASFTQVESTQLAAGTAPDLLFNQATYKPYMVVHLNSYLNGPNPFVPGNKKWLSVFNPKYFGPKIPSLLDTSGYLDYTPVNLAAFGIFYNKTAFAKAHVTAPIATFADLMKACSSLKAAGYTPFAMDNSLIGTAWTADSLYNMLTWAIQPSENHFNAAGEPGTNPILTTKDVTWAVATGKVSTSSPQSVAWLTLLKQFYDNCVTPNWSGITGLSGDGAGLPQFESGKAAMAWAVDFGFATVQSGSNFPIASVPFPTVTKASTPVSVDAPAQFGLGTGDAYMIPANTRGPALKAAVLFLQFTSSPRYIKTWVDETGGIPAVSALPAPAATAGMAAGAWGEEARDGGSPPGSTAAYDIAPGVPYLEAYEGYLLGAKSLAQEESYLETLWKQGAAYNIQSAGWANESWAKALAS